VIRSTSNLSESRYGNYWSFNRHAEGHFRAAGGRASIAEKAGAGFARWNGGERDKAPEEGDRIRIGGLGTLEVRQREARTGRNPATGETMQIAASKKVAFRPAKELKEAV
jgi:DNA-binding protein HU-beta